MLRFVGHGVFGVALLVLALGGCNSANTDAPAADDVHAESWLLTHGAEAAEDVDSCKGCHAIDFAAENFGPGDVCMSCHNASPEDYPAGCVSCHGRPPAVGAHAAHNGLASVNNICSPCHADGGSGSPAHFNGITNVAIGAPYDAKTGGPGEYNLDGTCSGVSCHGGQDTPDWLLAFGNSINVETDCTSCHAYGTAQYNSYYSGWHDAHVGGPGSCLDCHNPAALAADHFSGLDTPVFEGNPAATISGSSIISYNPATKSCNPTCHITAKW
jgi:predicted CxxxxCH...CXXCH cytochrome family protein